MLDSIVEGTEDLLRWPVSLTVNFNVITTSDSITFQDQWLGCQ